MTDKATKRGITLAGLTCSTIQNTAGALTRAIGKADGLISAGTDLDDPTLDATLVHACELLDNMRSSMLALTCDLQSIHAKTGVVLQLRGEAIR